LDMHERESIVRVRLREERPLGVIQHRIMDRASEQGGRFAPVVLSMFVLRVLVL
jgi:hypothetical protein